MKKSFTLLEVLISITIFMIMILFLYKTLDQTKYSNKLFSQKEKKLENVDDLYNIFLEDVAQSSSLLMGISKDKEKNSIATFETSNTYHNPYFKNVTYMIGSTFKLIRIESLQKYNPTLPMGIDFFENAYIDVLLDDIEFFEAIGSGDKYIFAIKQKNKERIFLNTYHLNQTK